MIDGAQIHLPYKETCTGIGFKLMVQQVMGHNFKRFAFMVLVLAAKSGFVLHFKALQMPNAAKIKKKS